MRLIDADALPRHGKRGGIVLWKDIEDAPTIVVRCKDCRFYEPYEYRRIYEDKMANERWHRETENPCGNCQEFDCYGCEYRQTEREGE